MTDDVSAADVGLVGLVEAEEELGVVFPGVVFTGVVFAGLVVLIVDMPFDDVTTPLIQLE